MPVSGQGYKTAVSLEVKKAEISRKAALIGACNETHNVHSTEQNILKLA